MPSPTSSPLSGLCANCRYVEPALFRYTAQPWDVAYVCSLRAAPLAPHALHCLRHERAAGAD